MEIKEEKCQSFFEDSVNGMSIGCIHDAMPKGHNISGGRLLIPLKVNTIV